MTRFYLVLLWTARLILGLALATGLGVGSRMTVELLTGGPEAVRSWIIHFDKLTFSSHRTPEPDRVKEAVITVQRAYEHFALLWAAVIFASLLGYWTNRRIESRLRSVPGGNT
jgi:hypothetical protein